jgi:HEAT repeat protein
MWLLFLGIGASILAETVSPPPDPAALVAIVEKLAAQAVPDERVQAGYWLAFRGALKPAGEAMEQLAALGQAALPALTKLLQHERAQVRQNAAHYLGVIRGPQIVPPLARALQDGNPGVRDQAVWALGRSASPAAVPLLDRTRGDDPDLAVRRRAAVEYRFLVRFLEAEKAATVEERVARLVPLAAHDLARSRLVEIGSPAVPALVAALEDADPAVADGAAATLAAIGDERGLAPLMDHYRASLQEGPRAAFAEALAAYRHPAAVACWQQLLQSPDPVGQYWGLRAIAASDRPDRQRMILDFLEQQVARGEHRRSAGPGRTQVNPTAEACQLLGEIGDEQALPLLRRILADVPEDQNIIRPLAERSCKQIEERLNRKPETTP